MAQGPKEAPGSGRFAPGLALVRLQIHARSDPRRYARRAGLVCVGVTLLVVVPAVLLVLPRDGLAPDQAWLALGAAVGLVLVGVGVFALCQALFRWVVGGTEVPAVTEPHRRRTAGRYVRRGQLSGDPALDALGRRLSVQAERMMSPLYWAPVAVVAVLHGLTLVLQLAGGQVTPLRVTMLVLVVAVLVVLPLVLRTRLRRARAFRVAHDARYGIPAPNPPREPWVSGPRNAPQR
ncbi:hypothetical protein [Nocardiopsis salina]|uniref:hypothetical protein n=1 Tax=Nocardiopsis salina TaxID=245836 RepID=UPI0012681A93|nr:hypothetical protein [Nocardiopsis salina]